jgi:23S rRNA (cytosine1962-C5)-methyltransferase
MNKLKKLRLKSKEERRFKAGHPWVFSNELQESPKSLGLGELVELCDAGGAFLAYGFGNPNSLISFRELTRDQNTKHIQEGVLSSSLFAEKFETALQFRRSWFKMSDSFRMIYGEADGLSGLIIDRFVGKESTVYVLQPHASGMDQNLNLIREALVRVSKSLEDKSALIIIRRDASSREKEGLEKIAPEVTKLQGGPVDEAGVEKLKKFAFQVAHESGTSLILECDLISGQKTGFFFDQLQNVKRLQTVLREKLSLRPAKKVEVLDLCAYVGQWGAHLQGTLSSLAVETSKYVAVDVSATALSFARSNVESSIALAQTTKKSYECEVGTLKADVLEPMEKLTGKTFDVVIADPPAFIKNRKSIPQGKQAYVQLFQTAIEKTAPGGLVVVCSCSQLLTHDEFLECIGKATKRSKKTVRWLTEGSPSFDHFARLDFQEGVYLKSFIGQVS